MAAIGTFHLLSCIDLKWCLVVQRLMRSLIVIELEVLWQLEYCIHHRVVVIYVYFFILDTTPEAFNKDIIQGSDTAIHTDDDSVWLQLTGEFIIGELLPGQYWIFQALIAVMPFPVCWYRTLSQGLWIPHWKEHTDCTSLWWPPDRRIRISSTHKWCQQLRHSRDDLWPALVTNMETSCAPLMGDSVEVWGRWLRSPLASSTGIPAFDWPCSPGVSTRLSIYGTHKTDAWCTPRL